MKSWNRSVKTPPFRSTKTARDQLLFSVPSAHESLPAAHSRMNSQPQGLHHRHEHGMVTTAGARTSLFLPFHHVGGPLDRATRRSFLALPDLHVLSPLLIQGQPSHSKVFQGRLEARRHGHNALSSLLCFRLDASGSSLPMAGAISSIHDRCPRNRTSRSLCEPTTRLHSPRLAPREL